MYLRGFDESRNPLSPSAMLDDIMQDYANKTATIESNPHFPSLGPHLSIHPCKHAAAMKTIIDSLIAGGGKVEGGSAVGSAAAGGAAQRTSATIPSVDDYLLVFLKFLQTIIPTIDYDFTTGVRARG